MKKWYDNSYVNKTNYILENYKNFNLTMVEGLLVLMINHANENQISLTTDCLANMCNCSQEEVDKAISLLCAKKYLAILANSSGLFFDLSGLFDTEVAKSEKAVNQDLYQLFESEFQRPLTSSEMILFSEWSTKYDRKLMIYALKEASLYKKVNMKYISSILDNWSKHNYTAQMIENGKHLKR